VSIDREQIYTALFNRLKGKLAGSSLVTIGRRHIAPPSLSPAQQPALFVCGVGESSDPKPRGTTGKLKLTAVLFLYAWESAVNETPGTEHDLAATQINQLRKAIDDALAPTKVFPNGAEFPDPNGVQTLGGLVSHCWTEGDTLIDPGIEGQQAFVTIPISILVP
jgi:hypothetical protein